MFTWKWKKPPSILVVVFSWCNKGISYLESYDQRFSVSEVQYSNNSKERTSPPPKKPCKFVSKSCVFLVNQILFIHWCSFKLTQDFFSIKRYENMVVFFLNWCLTLFRRELSLWQVKSLDVSQSKIIQVLSCPKRVNLRFLFFTPDVKLLSTCLSENLFKRWLNVTFYCFLHLFFK